MPGEVLVMRDMRCGGCGRKLARYLIIEGTVEIQCPSSRCKMVTTVSRGS